MNLSSKRILVTGADGFIGSHLVEHLVGLGADVRAFVYYNSFNSWGWLDRSPSAVKSAVDGCGVLDRFATSDQTARRQDLPELFTLNGAMYWIATDRLRQTKQLVNEDTLGFVMDSESSVDIDTMFDWRIAELLLDGQRA